jgi:tRNA threonylcarbamoyladenosine biosynthesis protein TsaE
MSAWTFVTESAEETRALACALGACLRAGDVLCLVGDLGAGKTTWVQGLAMGLGLPADEPIRSPTFTLVSEHLGGRVPLYHFDVYRLGDESGLADIGFSEYLDAGGVAVIEWADLILEALPSDRLELHLTLGDALDMRVLAFRAHGPRAETLLREFRTLEAR